MLWDKFLLQWDVPQKERKENQWYADLVHVDDHVQVEIRRMFRYDVTGPDNRTYKTRNNIVIAVSVEDKVWKNKAFHTENDHNILMTCNGPLAMTERILLEMKTVIYYAKKKLEEMKNSERILNESLENMRLRFESKG